jgi:hypothetical protein
VEGERLTTIILPLEPQEEAKLIALAQEKGVTTDALVRGAINAMLAEAGNTPVLEPIHSLRITRTPAARFGNPDDAPEPLSFWRPKLPILSQVLPPARAGGR